MERRVAEEGEDTDTDTDTDEDEALTIDDLLFMQVPSGHNKNLLLLFNFMPAFFNLLFPLAQADEMCAPWQNPPRSRTFFKSNGRVRARAFCRAYARNQGDCKEHLEALRKALERVQKADNNIQKLEARLRDLEQAQEDEEFERMLSDDEETEAQGLCVNCWRDLRGALAPSGWQRFRKRSFCGHGFGAFRWECSGNPQLSKAVQ